jgi:hypothetical protein
MPSEQRSDKMLVDLRESSGFYILQTVLRSTEVSQSSYEYVPTGIVLVTRSLVFPNDHIALVTDKRLY